MMVWVRWSSWISALESLQQNLTPLHPAAAGCWGCVRLVWWHSHAERGWGDYSSNSGYVTRQISRRPVGCWGERGWWVLTGESGKVKTKQQHSSFSTEKEPSSLLKLDWKSPLPSSVVIMLYASHYTVWQKQPVSFRNAIIHPLHVFCRFCYATSQTLIDPTQQHSMGTTVANCGGILRYGGSIRLCSTVARIIHRRWLQKHACASLPGFHHFVTNHTWHPPHILGTGLSKFLLGLRLGT